MGVFIGPPAFICLVLEFFSDLTGDPSGLASGDSSSSGLTAGSGLKYPSSLFCDFLLFLDF